MSAEQLMSVCEVALQCDVVSVRVNALAILGITGSTLAHEMGSADRLQVKISTPHVTSFTTVAALLTL